MARKGVAILREIAMVKSAPMDEHIRHSMLKELSEELAALYAPVVDTQQRLPLDAVHDVKAVKK